MSDDRDSPVPSAARRAGYGSVRHSSATGEPYQPRSLISASAGISASPAVASRSRAGGRKEIFCAFGIDVDGVAGWLGSYGGEDSPCDISRGLFAGEVGVPRLVQLFDRLNVKTTWFIPGHSIETFPEQW